MKKLTKPKLLKKSLKEKYIHDIKSNQFSSSNFINQNKRLDLSPKNIKDLHDDILFILNHPYSESIRAWAFNQLRVITQWCKKNKKRYEEKLENSGLPYSTCYSLFSFTLTQWMKNQNFSIQLNSYKEESEEFNEIFSISLPSYLRDKSQLGMTNQEWFDYLCIKEKNQLSFILSQFGQIKNSKSLRDLMFEKQQFGIQLYIDTPERSRTYNHLEFSPIYYHSDWLKKINTNDWIKLPVNQYQDLTDEQKYSIAYTSRLKLLLLQRETDPVTYMDKDSIRYYSLERGIDIALFTMTHDKQLPYESYVGYTLYKNGYPAAYGGAWIFGEHALIGLNIFDWCRGGESGLFFNNLLRVYHQIFKIQHFEIEPYQYGKDNEEGIASGAFWFYYRMGFVPVDKKLSILAHKEFTKINNNSNYKSTPHLLKKFTDSNLVLHFSQGSYLTLSDVKKRIQNKIQKLYRNNFHDAELNCIKKLTSIQYGINNEFSYDTLVEFAYLVEAMDWINEDKSSDLIKLIEARLKNPYEYQSVLRKIINLH